MKNARNLNMRKDRLAVLEQLFFNDNSTKFFWIMYHLYENDQLIPIETVTQGTHPFQFIKKKQGYLRNRAYVLMNWKEISQMEYDIWIVQFRNALSDKLG